MGWLSASHLPNTKRHILLDLICGKLVRNCPFQDTAIANSDTKHSPATRTGLFSFNFAGCRQTGSYRSRLDCDKSPLHSLTACPGAGESGSALSRRDFLPTGPRERSILFRLPPPPQDSGRHSWWDRCLAVDSCPSQRDTWMLPVGSHATHSWESCQVPIRLSINDSSRTHAQSMRDSRRVHVDLRRKNYRTHVLGIAVN